MTDDRHIAEEDLALYAMQSLSEEEADSVRAHLSTCAPCRSNLAEISGDLALLALSAETTALPAEARQRFLEKLAAHPADASAQNLTGQPGRSTEVTQIQSIRGQRRRGPSIWVPWLAAAAMAITAIALGVQNRALNDELQGESKLVSNLAAKASYAQQVLETLTSPNAKRVTLVPGKMPDEPMGHATYLPDEGGLIFTANNLKPLPEGHTYELWLIPANEKAPIPAGLFHPDETGTASIVMPPLPAGTAAKAFGVTMEKVGGAQTPTMPILMAGAVPGA